MLNKEWYSKKDILKIYPISTATYKKRIKEIKPINTKFTRSNTGSPSRLIHHSVIDELFRKRRKLSKNEHCQTNKWVRNHYWNFIGNIVPASSSINDLKCKMRFFFEELKSLQIEKKKLTLYYSVEKNPKDKYYHAHFLIDCKKDEITLDEIKNKLSNICEHNTKKESRIYLEKYDTRFNKDGAIYSSKEERYFYEILS
jgi:hypothetical protein